METAIENMYIDGPEPGEVLERAWVALRHETYAEIIAGERAHDHRIIVDDHGTYRWEANHEMEEILMDHFGAKDLNQLFFNGAKKNDPLVRYLYRCMGYSLSGYHEIFYWDWNNEEADQWDPENDVLEAPWI
jgi:hypothetical protein